MVQRTSIGLAVPKVAASLERALKLAESVSGFIALGPSQEAYKGVLLCRLEVQYSLSLIQISLGLDLEPRRCTVKSGAEARLMRVREGLAEAAKLLCHSGYEEAATRLLDVDSTLGQIIISMRRQKKAT